MNRARWASLTAVLALACAPVDLRFGHEGNADAGDGGSDAGPPDGGPCGGCAGLPLICNADAGVCVECFGDGDCSAPRPSCNLATGRCVECTSPSACGFGQGCDGLTHRCGKACVTVLDCLTGFDGCGAAGLCRLCDNDRECADAGTLKCDVRIGRCVECTVDAECPPSAPHCDVTRGLCAGCLVSVDCGAGRSCDPATQRCAP